MLAGASPLKHPKLSAVLPPVEDGAGVKTSLHPVLPGTLSQILTAFTESVPWKSVKSMLAI